MKLLVLSDLHLELGVSFSPPTGGYDVVVLAGDIHSPGHKAIHWAQRDATFGGRPVVVVPGNHEFYGCELHAELEVMHKAAEGSNVHVLDRASVVIDGVRFLGCMLWTDFQLPVRQPDGSMKADVARALDTANRYMNDFRLVEMLAPAKRAHRGRESRRLLRAEDTLAMHWVDRDWLRRELLKSFEGPSIVVSHHAPSSGSVAEQYAADWLTPAFVSDLPNEFFDVPVTWIHGHTHSPLDYWRERCRVVSNPRGYRRRDLSFENPRFNPGCVVEVQPLSDDREWASMPAIHAERFQAPQKSLASRADMVDIAEAATLAGVLPGQLRAWARLKRPRVIAFEHADGLRFPRWQFEPALWPVVQQLATALDGSSATVLAWLETPAGAFEGRTPRAALEQGERAERVLALAGTEGL